jgi:hypothetical protein
MLRQRRRADQMPQTRCQHCGHPIMPVQNVARRSWTHAIKVSGIWVDGGAFCRTTKAEPMTENPPSENGAMT